MTKRLDLPQDELRRRYDDERQTTKQIGAEMGVSSTCVLNNLRRHGIPIRSGRERHHRKEEVELHRQGLWKCNVCDAVKQSGEFISVERYWTGHDYMCRACQTMRRGEWRKQNPWRNRAAELNHRANRSFVTAEDLVSIWEREGGQCFYCRKDLNREDKRGLSFDHVEPGKHQADNLVATCFRCNTLKSDATAFELERIASRTREFMAGAEHELAFA